MKEKFGSSNPWETQEAFEKRTIGPLSYTVEPQIRGPAVFNFGDGFLIGGRIGSKSRDFRDQIAFEAKTIRTDTGLIMPETAELVEGEDGLVFFTLPESKLKGVIYKVKEGEARGDYWVQVATPEVMENVEKRMKEQKEDDKIKELPPQKQIVQLVGLGRDQEAKAIADKLKLGLDYAIAVKQRDAKKK